jgi:hypothetical protein
VAISDCSLSTVGSIVPDKAAAAAKPLNICVNLCQFADRPLSTD